MQFSFGLGAITSLFTVLFSMVPIDETYASTWDCIDFGARKMTIKQQIQWQGPDAKSELKASGILFPPKKPALATHINHVDEKVTNRKKSPSHRETAISSSFLFFSVRYALYSSYKIP